MRYVWIWKHVMNFVILEVQILEVDWREYLINFTLAFCDYVEGFKHLSALLFYDCYYFILSSLILKLPLS